MPAAPADAASTVAAWPVFDENIATDIVIIGKPAKLDFPGAFTITAWAAQDDTPTPANEFFISRDDTNGGANRGYLCTQRDDTGVPRWLIWRQDPAGGIQDCQGVGDYADDTYHFYTFINEGLGGDLVLWIDGVLNATDVGGGGVLVHSTQNNTMGRNETGVPSGFSGRLDTARYYGRALSADEILRDYYAGLATHTT